jgi:competence/damage-inducible protein CinA-like protein
MPVAETIAIGTELLLGEIQDTNTRYLARQFRNMGVNFFRATIIGDNPTRIAEVIKESAERADIVITSGGLGPTIDDPTREAIALAAGVDLEFHEELWIEIQERFARFGRKPTENNRKQAYLPAGSSAISNPVGTAPAFSIEIDDSLVICLPGVPRELETLLEKSVLPLLKSRFDLRTTFHTLVLHAAGVGESQIDEWISDLEKKENPTVGLLAHPGITDIRVTARANSEEKAFSMVMQTRETILQRIGDSYFGDDEMTLEQVVEQLLEQTNTDLEIYPTGFGQELQERILTSGSNRILINVNESKDFTTKSPESNIFKDQKIIIRANMIPSLEKTLLEIEFLTPDGMQKISRSHGGHPGLAQLWADNLIMDLIRRYLYNKLKQP